MGGWVGDLVGGGADVGDAVGGAVGLSVTFSVGAAVGEAVGGAVGLLVGELVGVAMVSELAAPWPIVQEAGPPVATGREEANSCDSFQLELLHGNRLSSNCWKPSNFIIHTVDTPNM